ncbi:hypothetical protein [Bacillus sp. ISL-57]|uniref:hypothetical protein n=1 Tax=Bacillus sp. ISL-57 TaxID=2819135 RepID=UPI001BE50A9E|nr:hypothetical protein [Bacillus sp. ISL-57]MBT2716889.1 hypothetical protein [Bacillus sp. ISL-57]
MSYYEEDFYNEPSEFEMQVDEFRESLLKAVKEEFVSEMDRLKKENAELQEIKTNFKTIKSEYDQKSRKLEYERQDLERKVRRERLSSLLNDFEVEYYTVASRSKYKPKCDKCDENRRLYYTTPSGRKTYESCECSNSIPVFEPIPILLSTFSIRRGEGHAWYSVKYRGDDDEYLNYYEDSIHGNELITDEKQFKDIGYAYKTLFETKEIAQKFCDYKNSNEV